jgi:hypothetical protein
MPRQANTGRDMVESGQWAKLASKHYRRYDGLEIKYDCNAYVWRIVGTSHAWSLLWVTRDYAERWPEWMGAKPDMSIRVV